MAWAMQRGYYASGHHSRFVQFFVLLASAARASWHRWRSRWGRNSSGRASYPGLMGCRSCTVIGPFRGPDGASGRAACCALSEAQGPVTGPLHACALRRLPSATPVMARRHWQHAASNDARRCRRVQVKGTVRRLARRSGRRAGGSGRSAYRAPCGSGGCRTRTVNGQQAQQCRARWLAR